MPDASLSVDTGKDPRKKPTTRSATDSGCESRIASVIKKLSHATASYRHLLEQCDELQKSLNVEKEQRRKLAEATADFPTISEFHEREFVEKESILQKHQKQRDALARHIASLQEQLSMLLARFSSNPSTQLIPPDVLQDVVSRLEAAEKKRAQDQNRIAELEQEREKNRERIEVMETAIQGLVQQMKELQKDDERAKEMAKVQNRIRMEVKSLEKVVGKNQEESEQFRGAVESRLDALVDDLNALKVSSINESTLESRLAVLSREVTATLTPAETMTEGQAEARKALEALEALEALDKRLAQLESKVSQMPQEAPATAKSSVDESVLAALQAKIHSDAVRNANEMTKLQQQTTALKGMDNHFIEHYGALIEKNRKDLADLSAQGRDAAASVQQLKMAMNDISLKTMELIKRSEAHDMHIGSLLTRWNNVQTKDFAERVIGWMERLYPQPNVINATILDLSARVRNLETVMVASSQSDKKRKSLHDSIPQAQP